MRQRLPLTLTHNSTPLQILYKPSFDELEQLVQERCPGYCPQSPRPLSFDRRVKRRSHRTDGSRRQASDCRGTRRSPMRGPETPLRPPYECSWVTDCSYRRTDLLRVACGALASSATRCSSSPTATAPKRRWTRRASRLGSARTGALHT